MDEPESSESTCINRVSRLHMSRLDLCKEVGYIRLWGKNVVYWAFRSNISLILNEVFLPKAETFTQSPLTVCPVAVIRIVT
jgi:hypothetical protein